MDVLHVTHQSAPETRGGVESYVADVTREQMRRGLSVHLLTGSHVPWEKVGIEDFVHEGLPVHKLHRDDWFFDLHSKAWHPGARRAIAEFVARERPGVVHLHHWIRLSSDLVDAIQALGVPVVVTLHDFYTSCPRAFRMRPGSSACHRPLSVESCLDCVPRYGHESAEELSEGILLFRDQYRSELRRADAVIVGVESTADMVSSKLGVDRSLFRVLPLGYRRRFDGLARPRPPLPGEAVRFAFWGGVAKHKGIDVLVEACRILCARNPKPRFEMHVLGGFATPELEHELRGAGDGLPIRFHGPFTIEELLSVAPHVGVFPSTCLETFGIVLDECVELGLPSIVSNHGALAARAGQGALRAKPGDPADLAAKILSLCEDRSAHERLREGLPDLPPPVEAHCDALAAIYEEARRRRASAPPWPPEVGDERRAAFLLRQRESALGRAAPSGPKDP
ncbi:MAG: glycosyltransferase family 4 protein [Planctomycetota bacterium]